MFVVVVNKRINHPLLTHKHTHTHEEGHTLSPGPRESGPNMSLTQKCQELIVGVILKAGEMSDSPSH